MQKFFRGHRIKIDDEMPTSMKHFTSGAEAIVEYSYSDVHSNEEHSSYSLLILEPTGSHSSAWYWEDQLTLVDNDRDKGEKILQEHKQK